MTEYVTFERGTMLVKDEETMTGMTDVCVNQTGRENMDKSTGTRRLAAALTAGMLVGEGSSAYAGGIATFNNLSENIVNSSAGLPSMISTVAYVGGIGLGVAGIFKLKQHVDNPAQTMMKDGLVRLGAGGGLLALPYLTAAMQGSVNGGLNVQATETPFAPPLPGP